MGQALADSAQACTRQYTVHTSTLVVEGEECRLVEQGLQRQAGAFADQLDIEPVQGADAFGAAEGEHLRVAGQGVGEQAQTLRRGGGEHPMSLSRR